ncbi:glycine dehydrogenase [Desulfosarcina ovata subsp. sediminis]|uniref:glycine dehydrogenase (aminomethyl-transferring) n=1 Tax=Desulfosarcina ovata subsp. sediminis TaxID=885957 RepID=A0A5K7ZF41_9BACT|nr:aminomethyl-transferring glycine dehydrogenase subunit GcvPB [Desulfosarcina ovata]BBO79894.1 glycine dehydrogenase [Desulfosarcina ovata subsp. sediminis]
MQVGHKRRLRDFHQARWDEELIFELSVPGERGVLVPEAEEKIRRVAGDGISTIPAHLRRKTPPALPEVNQPRIVRHYTRLSQETLGVDVTPDISLATCTMKYSPKVQEHVVSRHPGITQVHPLQDEDTLQGILEIYYQLEQFLKAISGMDHFSFQPGGGAQAIFTNASVMRTYHASRGESQRDEVITTIFSHPANPAAAATAGYKVVTLMPDERGLPSLEAMRAALSERTAGFLITNPEDTGIYNSNIDKYVQAAHDAGALCAYDQANANAVLGIARARECGFDLCHFNLHKTFSAPHGCMGPALGAAGVTEALEKFLPVPRVTYDGKTYHLDDDRPHSIGRVRSFIGNVPVALKAYAWIRQLGGEGLREVARCSVLNSNYLEKEVRRIPGVTVHYAEGRRRLEQVRFSWETLKEETGVGTEDIKRRIADFGLQHYWTSHHPWVVPEPFTLEPCESYSKADIDEYAAVLAKIAQEAYNDPEFVKNAPYRSTVHKIPDQYIDEADRIAITWRQYLKKGLNRVPHEGDE